VKKVLWSRKYQLLFFRISDELPREAAMAPDTKTVRSVLGEGA
jgi:hypothetical protein